MNLICNVRQYYRYLRNLKKIRTRRSKTIEYFRKQLQFYSQFIKEGDLCFDIGANIGDKTEVYVKLGAKVVSVEPQQSCWLIIKRRFADNPSVFIEPVVLAENEGERTLYVDKSPTISSISEDWIRAVKESGRFSDSHKWSYKIQVKSLTLDSLIEKYGKPAFCKIDVEGSEFEVVQGLSQPVNVLSFEFIPEYLDPVLACIDYLSKLGKAEFNYSLTDSALALPEWINADNIIDMLQAFSGKSTMQGDIYVKFPETRKK